MTSEAILRELPGGGALLDLFGHVPRFHDAYLLEINRSSKEESVLRIHTWEMTDKIDGQGYFVLDKHVVVTIKMRDVTHIALNEFSLPGIIHFLDVTKADDTYQFVWIASYCVEGMI